MAKAKRKSRAVSERTGLLWPCPAMGVLHPGKRIALPIRSGPRCYFVKCPICYSALFMGREWSEGLGMTEAEARRQGYITL